LNIRDNKYALLPLRIEKGVKMLFIVSIHFCPLFPLNNN